MRKCYIQVQAENPAEGYVWSKEEYLFHGFVPIIRKGLQDTVAICEHQKTGEIKTIAPYNVKLVPNG